MADLDTQCREVFNIPVRLEISTEQVGSLAVVVAFVPEAQPQDKPIFFKAPGLPKGALRRIGSTDQHCTDDDLAVCYQGRQRDSFDAALVPDTTLDDLTPGALADYRQARAETNRDAEELRWSNGELLRSLGYIAKDSGGTWHPTVARLVLFGQAQALRRCFPMTRVNNIRVPGREWVPDPERRFDTVELRDALFRLIRRAQAAVLDDLPKGFNLPEGELQRQDKPVIPGSEPRNPRIAAVLHETRFAETKGSGIRVVRETMEQAGLTPPLYESDRPGDQLVARYFFHHFLGAADIAWLANFKDAQLNSEDAKALIVVREAGAIDNATYRALIKVDTLAASAALRRLRDAGLLAQKGRGSATCYVPAERLGLAEPDKGAGGKLSSHPSGLSSNSPAPSAASARTRLDDEARHVLLDDLPGSLAARLGATGQRHPPQEIQSIVVDLCASRALRADELSLVLRRNREVVRQNYLRPLMKEGRIAMTRPEKPNSPQQAYRAIQVA